jgi:Domain of unknown function (DUF4396)
VGPPLTPAAAPEVLDGASSITAAFSRPCSGWPEPAPPARLAARADELAQGFARAPVLDRDRHLGPDRRSAVGPLPRPELRAGRGRNRVLRANLTFSSALALAFAADTASITVMEIVDNAIMLLIPGAMDAGLTSLLLGEPGRLSCYGGYSRLSREPLADCPGSWPLPCSSASLTMLWYSEGAPHAPLSTLSTFVIGSWGTHADHVRRPRHPQTALVVSWRNNVERQSRNLRSVSKQDAYRPVMTSHARRGTALATCQTFARTLR